MVMIPDIHAPLEQLERAVDQRLREWVGPEVQRDRAGGSRSSSWISWTWATPRGQLFAVLELPVASALTPDVEPALELIRVIRTLGRSGAFGSDDASAALADGANLLHTRFCIGSDPAGSLDLALLLQGTLYPADLQREEFDALIGELLSMTTAPCSASQT